MHEQRSVVRRPRLRRALAPVAAGFGWAVLCNLAIELLQSSGGFTFALKPALFLLGSTLLWLGMLVVWGLTGRLRVAAAVVGAAAVLIGYANHIKMELRREPLFPEELAVAQHTGFLEQMVGWRTILGVLGVTLLVGALSLTAGWWWRRRRPRRRAASARERAGRVLGRLTVAAVSLGLLACAAQFNQQGNAVRWAYEAGGADWASWSQEKNYTHNGFVGGMLYNLDVPVMRRPDGYSRAAMADIVRRYSEAAGVRNAARSPDALSGVNLVVVLSESFSDPTRLEGIELAEDPIPFTRRLMASTTSGDMLAQRYGSGTANMEFETLTGMSTSQFDPRLMTPYQMLVPRFEEFPSFVGLTKSMGYTDVAVHPYDTYMYRRETVYPKLGFDDFLGKSELTVRKRIQNSPFISDNSAFAEVLHQIDVHEEPVFTHLVTMQNHFPMGDSYDAPMTIRGVSGSSEEEAAAYVRGLTYSDRALRKFVTALEGSEERTAVLYFGDHLPPIWPDEVVERNGPTGMRRTPFFMWTNFLSLQSPQPLTSPVFFLPLLMDQLGAPLPPYYELLRQLHSAVPAMRAGILYDAAGRRVDRDDLSPEARQLLRDYRLVQYDLSVGRRFAQDGLFYPLDTRSAAAE